MTPKEIVIKITKRSAPTHQRSSASGIDIEPHESPATICENNVRAAEYTLLNPLLHRGQLSNVVLNNSLEEGRTDTNEQLIK